MKRTPGLGLKRAFDVAFSLLLLLVLGPVMVVVALLVRSKLGSPVLFTQPRIGMGGKIFTLHKFRTMTDDRGPDGELLPDDVRLTALGRRIRSLTLDELPELFDVLRGDMSIVGPRPLLVEYRELYTPEQWRRHDMRPGMAGPVLAGGRNALTWDDKFALDTWYVDNWSFALDMRILWRTVISVLKREGLSAEGHATMPRFTGSPSENTD